MNLGNTPEKPYVVVLGAGIAGLIAAYRLVQDGCNVVVIEASARPGGRIESITLPDGGIFEAGAEWVAKDHTYLIGLCKQFGIPLLPLKPTPAMHLGGKNYPADDPAITDTIKRLKQEASSLLTLTPEQKQHLSSTRATEYLEQLGLPKAGTAYISLMASSDFGADFADISAYDLLSYEYYGFEHTNTAAFTIEGGAERLVRALVEAIGPEKILLNKTVNAIYTTQNFLTVQCDDGSLYSPHYAVCTLPLPAMEQIHWEPTLPRPILDCFGATTYRQVAKECYVFDKPLSGDEPVDVLTDFTVQHVHTPTPVRSGTSALVSYAAGSQAERLTRLTDTEVTKELIDAADGKLPADAKLVKRIRRSAYATMHPLYAYSNFPAADEDAIDEVYKKPVDGIYFAGEHTALIHGYMDGAVYSGLRAAMSIIHNYPLSKSPIFDSKERTEFFNKHQFPFYNATADIDEIEISYPYAMYTCHKEPAATIDTLSAGAVLVAKTFDAVLDRMKSWSPDDFAEWGFPPEYQQLFAYATDKPFCLRAGWGKDASGQWKLIEINSQTPGFWIETEFGNPLLAQHFHQQNPHPRSAHYLRSAINSSVATSLASLPTMPDKPVVGFVACDFYEDLDNVSLLASYCEFPGEIVKFDRLDFDADNRPINTETGTTFDCLMLWYPLEWLVKDTFENGDKVADVMLRGVKAGAFALAHAVSSFFIQPKSLLAYITAHADDLFVGELAAARPFFTETYLAKQPHMKDYITKPIWGREGRGCVIVRDGQEPIYGRYQEEYYTKQPMVYQELLELPKQKIGGKDLVLQYETFAYRTGKEYKPGGTGIRATEHLISDEYSYWLPLTSV